MKRLLFALLVFVFVFAACEKDESILELSIQEIYASIETEEQTKTVLDEKNNVRWSSCDQIVAFMKTSLGVKYQIKDEYIGQTSGYFSKVSSGSSDDLGAGMELNHNVVYYPYSKEIDVERSNDNYFLNVVIPSTQKYVANSFDNGAFPMVAVSDDNDISFKNVCGGIKLQLKGSAKIKKIKLQGANNELLSGSATVTCFSEGSAPIVEMGDNASKVLVLDCGEGVQLNENVATAFIMTLPPTEFKKGFTVTIVDTKGKEEIMSTEKLNNVKRSTLLVMPEKNSIVHEIEIPNNQIWYTTTHGDIARVRDTWGWYDDDTGEDHSGTCFGAKIISNVYENGKGVITFDGDVTKVENQPFDSFYIKDVVSVKLPNSVKEIGAYAFYNTHGGLSEIYLGDGITSIGAEAFACCSFENIDLPENLEYIGEDAFRSCKNLNKINIPDKVGFIGQGAFYGCKALRNITGKCVAEDNQSIVCNNTLIYVTPDDNMTEYTTPNGVSNIGSYLFCSSNDDFPNLKNIYIQNGVLKIGDRAFCDIKANISVPTNIKYIGESAFASCSNLISVDLQDITYLGNFAFSWCKNLKRVTLGDELDYIPEGAFQDCTSLEDITMGHWIKSCAFDDFGNLSFGQSAALKNIYITAPYPPDLALGNFRTLDLKIFVPKDSEDLYKAKYPENAHQIEGRNFVKNNEIWYYSNDGAVSVNPNNFNAKIISNKCTRNYGIITFDKDVTSIGESAFINYDNIETIILPESVVEIGSMAFSGCELLTKINIPHGVTSIKSGTFSGCKSLKSIELPSTIESIGYSSFQRCTNLENVLIYTTMNLKSLGNYAFHACTSLKGITLPGTICEIGNYAFLDCNSLQSVFCMADTPPSLGDNVFYGTHQRLNIYVPRSSVNKYLSNTDWSSYSSHVAEYDYLN